MKKVTVLFLAFLLAMALATPCLAEGAAYIRTLPQYTYISSTLLTDETCPEIRIFPEYAYTLFSDYGDAEPVFLCIPIMDGAKASSIRSYEVACLDPDKAIQVQYMVRKSDSFEEFVNEAEADEYILRQGDDGTAAFIKPERGQAFGMIAATEFGKSAKLIISMGLDYLDSKMPLETRVQALTDAILSEVDRVSAGMRYETMAPYWSAGMFAGMKLLDDSFASLVEMDFQPITLTTKDGETIPDIPFIPTEVDDDGVKGIYAGSKGNYVEAEFSFDSNPFPAYQLEQQEEGASREKLQNGDECLLYVSQYDGEIGHWYASFPLKGLEDNDKQVFMTVHLTGNHVAWKDAAQCLAITEGFAQACRVVPVEEDPYVPQEKPADVQGEEANAPAAQDAPAAEGQWTCPSCGQVNDGNFCPNCGAARPE